MRRGPRRHRRPISRHDEAGDPKSSQLPEHFQICVHVISARNLNWSFPLSGTAYVMMVYNGKKRRTNVKRKMVELVFRETFFFETCKTVRDLELSRIWVGVMETRCCSSPKLLGEGMINLASIWTQPNHQVDEKWVQLTSTSLLEPVGFVKCGVLISYKGDFEVQNMKMHTNNITPNIFFNSSIYQPSSSSEQQKANYQFIIYAAFGVNAAEKRHRKPINSFVKVTFCGLLGKTGIKYHDNNPVYCEQITMLEMFPNTQQKVKFEVCLHENVSNKVLASTYLNLNWICHDGDNGFVPTFGPSLLHMYTTLSNQPEIEGPYHRGALLVALRTVVPVYSQTIRTVNVQPVTPVNVDTIWHWESFCIYCPILELSMIDGWFKGQCGVSVTIGELFNDYGELDDKGIEAAGLRKLNYFEEDLNKDCVTSINFSKGYPVLQLAARLPDFRFRIYRNNILNRIVDDMSAALVNIEFRLNSVNNDSLSNISMTLSQTINEAAARTQSFLDAAENQELKGQATELDCKQLVLMKHDIQNIHQKLSDLSAKNALVNYSCTKKDVKMCLKELKHLVDTTKGLLSEVPYGWPDILVWVISAGERIAYYRLSPADILYSPEIYHIGRNSGKVQTLYFKPLKCYKHQNSPKKCHCKIAKIELQLWMGLYKQYYAFEDSIPPGYKIQLRGYNLFLTATYMIVECRIFINDAKLKGFSDTQNTKSNVFVRLHVLNKVCETMFQPKSSLVSWNQVIKIQIETYTTTDKLKSSPPEVTVDLVERPSQSKEYLIGRVNIIPTLDDRQSYECAPKLRSYQLLYGEEKVGEIIMSVQLLQIPENIIKTTSYTSSEEHIHEDVKQELSKCGNCYEVEDLPDNMLPQMELYKVDIKWWGLRKLPIIKKPRVVLEINTLTVKSEVVLENKCNCNFPQGQSSYTFEAPFSEPHWPALSFKLYDCSTFGRTLFLGAHIVKNPNKFFIKWLSQTERDRMLKGKQNTMPQFYPASLVYVTNEKSIRDEFLDQVYCDNINTNKTKFSKLKKIIYGHVPKKDQYILIPMNIGEERPIEKIAEKKDWWQRYFSSKNRLNDDISKEDKIVIYPSELENQPEFSKFRDWCFNLKFYNNQDNTLMREKDSDYCGSLKAGIAIYNWPPPGDTVAVNIHGVDLNKGYFSEYPSNETAKFLVRVYLVKVLNVLSKNYTERRNYSITISVGKKRFKNRQEHSEASNNSMIGEMYELLCTMPDDYLLCLSLYDTEGGPSEELVGTTVIDLEDRIYTKHRARVGLSPTYNLSNPLTKWRDPNMPSEILEQICALNHLPPPSYPDINTVILNGVQYKYNNASFTDTLHSTEKKESICLNILHQWHTMPVCGYQMVPEHLESRTLYRPDKPGLSQGQLLMWIDMYSYDLETIPLPVDITPPRIEEYELRIVVWEVQGLNIRNGKRNSMDIFVKGFIDGSDQVQTTEVCYGVKSGACFNWRMIFQLHYQSSEKKLIIKNKGPYTEYEERLPPNLIIQVVDNSTQTILASISLNLNNFPRGAKQAQNCALKIEERKKVDLFLTRSIRAWWSLDATNETGKSPCAIELDMTLLPKDQADLIPVGFGRGPPSPLPDPHPTNANCFLCSMRGGRANNFCSKDSIPHRNCFLCFFIGFAIILVLYFFYLELPTYNLIQDFLEVIGVLDSVED